MASTNVLDECIAATGPIELILRSSHYQKHLTPVLKGYEKTG